MSDPWNLNEKPIQLPETVFASKRMSSLAHHLSLKTHSTV